MKLLVSFCNQQNNAIHDNLVLLDTETKERKSFFDFLYNRSITGITQDEGRVYICYQDQVNGIIVLKKPDLEIEFIRSFPEIKDGHTILINANNLYVVSTGNDRILKFNLDTVINKIEYIDSLYLSPDANSNLDLNHINSIAIKNNEIYLTAFGKKYGEKWSTALNGYILNTVSGEKIFNELAHPHSLTVFNGDFWYAESLARKIKCNDKTIIELEEGYIRGLAITESSIVIGVSTGRSTSKSTNTPNLDLPPELAKEHCKVIVYKYDGNSAIKINDYEFIDKYQEIYDIAVLT